MISPKKWLLLLGGAIIVASAFYLSWPEPEAIYRGKRMSVWMRDLRWDPSTDGAVCRALCEGGAPVVPMVVKGLNARDDSRFYFWLWPKLPRSLQHRFAPPQRRNCCRYCCAFILGCIEPSTTKIVRNLRQAFISADGGEARFTAQALRMIAQRDSGLREELQMALPDLRRWAAIHGPHTDQVIRSISVIEGLSARSDRRKEA
jgi:hypothetical protein